jgi:hypothetical protein
LVSRAPAGRWSARVVAALAVVGTSATFAQETGVELSATLTPDPVGLEESVQLHLEVQSSGFRLPEIEPHFRLERLSRNGGPMRSQSHNWVNGKSTSRLELFPLTQL